MQGVCMNRIRGKRALTADLRIEISPRAHVAETGCAQFGGSARLTIGGGLGFSGAGPTVAAAHRRIFKMEQARRLDDSSRLKKAFVVVAMILVSIEVRRANFRLVVHELQIGGLVVRF